LLALNQTSWVPMDTANGGQSHVRDSIIADIQDSETSNTEVSFWEMYIDQPHVG
jgi:hypothetical protein